jgi:diphosphomevalonate decarboxylase
MTKAEAASSWPVFVAEAPANIALIKYMGKVLGSVDGSRGVNQPTNHSFSFTLDHLKTCVEIAQLDPKSTTYDRWVPLKKTGFIETTLSDSGRRRYLAHFEFLKQKLGVSGFFEVRSANNFPSDCGIASSASSFAALTLATYKIGQAQNPKLDYSLTKIAELSRVGSGSSIRSFMSPFVLWDENGVSRLEFKNLNLLHQLIIVDREKKAIGSSEAHLRVASSALFKGRAERANERLALLLSAFEKGEWAKAHELVWAEFWDMHALFATSHPPFQYMTSESFKVLQFYFEYWQKTGDGPLITMDAGANVHLLYREDQADLAAQLKTTSGFKFL